MKREYLLNMEIGDVFYFNENTKEVSLTKGIKLTIKEKYFAEGLHILKDKKAGYVIATADCGKRWFSDYILLDTH